ncbi:MAG: hypothetical protein HND55_12515 [Pseudomonadota bacterium]|nr:MAG: hypothetical protein HND55_12515 [Pseudomonadota bacterium]
MPSQDTRRLVLAVSIALAAWLMHAASSLSQQPAEAEWVWAADGDRVVFEFATPLLDLHGIRVGGENGATGRLALPLVPGGALRYQTVGASFEFFIDGGLELGAGVMLSVADAGSVELGRLRLEAAPGRLRLLTAAGQIAFVLVEPRVRVEPQSGRFTLDGAGLELTPWLAGRLRSPSLSGAQIGRLTLAAHTRQNKRSEQPLGACSEPVWPGTEGETTDVALVSMGTYAPNWGCDAGCTGSSTRATTWWSPSATLENQGSTDVPWYDWLGSGNSAPEPPYNNRQHPLLVWNLYRIDADNRLEQIGASGIKHGYYTTNVSCTCPGGHVLWSAGNTPNQVGCRDTYSASNNNENRRLGPRSDSLPAEAVWGRCRSLWDPDCDGNTTDHGLAAPSNRMTVRESDLAEWLNPEASYFLEAWYLIRDDEVPANNMRHVEVTTSWNGSSWSALSFEGAQSAGPFINRWVAPGMTALAANQLLETANGRARLAVRVRHLEGNWYRYDYALMNLDFAVPETQGTEPDLEVVSNNGFSGFAVPVTDGTNLSDIEFADGIREVTEWAFGHTGGQAVWQAPGTADTLNWGRLFRFGFSADRPPVALQALLTTGAENDRSTHAVMTLGPAFGLIFEDRYEAE